MCKSTPMLRLRPETARAPTRESFTCRLFIRGLDATRLHNPQKGYPGRHHLPGPRRLGAGVLQLAVGLRNTDDSGAIFEAGNAAQEAGGPHCSGAEDPRRDAGYPAGMRAVRTHAFAG